MVTFIQTLGTTALIIEDKSVVKVTETEVLLPPLPPLMAQDASSNDRSRKIEYCLRSLENRDSFYATASEKA